MKEVLIRPMDPGDNPGIAALIRRVLDDMGVPKTGTTYADESLDKLYGFYSQPRAAYLVAEADGRLLGGGGIAPLMGGSRDVCELQKMYFDSRIRGMGAGSRMLRQLLLMAEGFGYKQCYLETMPCMETAQNLYRKFGFEYLPAPMGNTGHHSCQVWMFLNLQTSRVR